MDRAFESGALVTQPTPPVSPSMGYPTNGNPGTGTPATIPGDWWYHMITEEIRAVIVAGGVTPDRASTNQLLQSLPGALATRPGHVYTGSDWAYLNKPGGLILQWGKIVSPPSENVNSTTTFPITFPVAALGIIAIDSATTENNAVVWAVDVLTAANVQAHWARSGMTLVGTSRTAFYLAFGN